MYSGNIADILDIADDVLQFGMADSEEEEEDEGESNKELEKNCYCTPTLILRSNGS